MASRMIQGSFAVFARRRLSIFGATFKPKLQPVLAFQNTSEMLCWNLPLSFAESQFLMSAFHGLYHRLFRIAATTKRILLTGHAASCLFVWYEASSKISDRHFGLNGTS
eukprot:4332762-Amphidinium_carterae.1